MTLTYDMTFIVILLNSLYESELKSSSHRCKTHPMKKQEMLQSEITDYAADMNLILSYYHLKDDWQDEKKREVCWGSMPWRGKRERSYINIPDSAG